MLEKIQRRLGQGSKFLLALRNSNRGNLPPTTLPEGCLYGTAEFNGFDFQNTSMEHVGSNRKLYIGDLAVRQDARRLGIAMSLLHTIESYAFQNGFDELYLHVETFNEPARRLYRKHGFLEQPATQHVSNFTEQLLNRPADSFSLMCKRLWTK
ncbi:GNAT family N-acetyltransferase [archaeon]|nr:MAG: GNAT family N-acetyltransferase [archaeon]